MKDSQRPEKQTESFQHFTKSCRRREKRTQQKINI